MNELVRRYLTPAEAAAALGTDIETIRQWVLWFDGEDERIPLYLEVTRNLRVLWHPSPDPNDGARKTHIVRDADKIGSAYLVDVTAWSPPPGTPTELIPFMRDYASGEIVSSEISLGPGLWLEIDPSDGHQIAGQPEESFVVHWLRAPPYALGPIPAGAIISANLGPKDQRLARAFHECWIAAEDIERIRKLRSAEARPVGASERGRNSLLRIVGSMLALLRSSDGGNFPSDASVISALESRHGNLDGVSKTNLESKFAEAKRLLGAAEDQ